MRWKPSLTCDAFIIVFAVASPFVALLAITYAFGLRAQFDHVKRECLESMVASMNAGRQAERAQLMREQSVLLWRCVSNDGTNCCSSPVTDEELCWTDIVPPMLPGEDEDH